MTPFGARLRQLRAARGVTLKAMALALQVSPAYLSALEHGHRGRPTWTLVQRVITFFNIIWDEADELERLAQVSNPRIVIDTSGLTPRATEFANRLAKQIGGLKETDLEKLLILLPADPRATL
ncbi:MAG: helix-turn-helix domain-containing protein [Beijerinckiaceae bacterium]